MENEYCERCPYWTIPEGIPDAEPGCAYVPSFDGEELPCSADIEYYRIRMLDVFSSRIDSEGIDATCKNVKLWLQCDYQADRIMLYGTYLALCNMADDIAAELKKEHKHARKESCMFADVAGMFLILLFFVSSLCIGVEVWNWLQELFVNLHDCWICLISMAISFGWMLLWLRGFLYFLDSKGRKENSHD